MEKLIPKSFYERAAKHAPLVYGSSKVSRYTSRPNKDAETATALKKGRDTRKSVLEMPPTTFLEYSWLS